VELTSILLPIFNGLSQGVLLFLIASGLSLVFGVLGVLNFAHGGFFMIGAYIGYTVAQGQQLSIIPFIGLVVGVGVITALLGVLTEVLLFRRIYPRDEIYQLLFTFALLLTIQGLTQQVWGMLPLSLPPPSEMTSAFFIFGAPLPQYFAFIIAIGFVVLIGLWLFLTRTTFGRLIHAVASDRWMASALGVNVSLVFTLVFGIGIFLAGMGGVLVAPTTAVSPGLAVLYIIQAFAVIVVGGMDNVFGGFIAAILLGIFNSFMVVQAQNLAQFTLYAGMILVLLLRPQGLLGAVRVRR
jgi:branched-chain amino acid transport system permease protein